MIYAYPEMYLEDAMKNLAELVEYSAEACKEDAARTLQVFVISGYAKRWETGDPHVICGISGTELHHRIMERCGLERENWPEALVRYDAGMSYWCGYMLAYYQWKKARPFSEILQDIPFSEWERLYSVLHTASEERAVAALDEIASKKRHVTRLQEYRKTLGLTQRELAERSGVNLRTLQQYEVRDKDLRQASAEKVINLARVLGCPAERLLEK